MTDHVSGDSRLVDYAVRFTTREGTLILAQVEDDGVFERYMEAISKISSIDTDGARQELLSRLLKDSADYIESCRTALAGKLAFTHGRFGDQNRSSLARIRVHHRRPRGWTCWS